MRKPIFIYLENGISCVSCISNIKTKNWSQMLNKETRLESFKTERLDMFSGVSRHRLIPLRGT